MTKEKTLNPKGILKLDAKEIVMEIEKKLIISVINGWILFGMPKSPSGHKAMNGNWDMIIKDEKTVILYHQDANHLRKCISSYENRDFENKMIVNFDLCENGFYRIADFKLKVNKEVGSIVAIELSNGIIFSYRIKFYSEKEFNELSDSLNLDEDEDEDD